MKGTAYAVPFLQVGGCHIAKNPAENMRYYVNQNGVLSTCGKTGVIHRVLGPAGCYQGQIPCLPVNNPVNNVNNFYEKKLKNQHNFCVMSTDIPSPSYINNRHCQDPERSGGGRGNP